MESEKLNDIATNLRDFARFARHNSIEIGIYMDDYEHEFDLGDFGYSSANISIQTDYYMLDASEVLDKFPIDKDTFEELADQLDEIAGELGDDDRFSLEASLLKMEAEGGAPLARAIREVVAAFRSITDPPDEGDEGSVPYDPLTVSLKEEPITVTTRELVPGDDIIGSGFGRVLGFDGGTIVMDNEGTRNRYDASEFMEGVWSIHPVDVPNRAAITPAYLVLLVS